ncbi:hypothetical protein SRHO_G00284050 [Serrasalmus rhombeus]
MCSSEGTATHGSGAGKSGKRRSVCYASICNLDKMDLFRWMCMVYCFIATQVQWTCWSLSVRFLHKKPIYVALGRTLVVEAQFELQPGETVRLVFWDRKSDSEVRLVTDGRPTDKRISVDKDGARLKLTGVTESDYGSYIITVTDQNGDQTPASVEVRKVQTPPVASFSLECTVVTEGEQWDKPVFSWWVDGQEITNNTGDLSADGSKLHLSADGSKLHLSGFQANNYTCVINSSQGTSVVQHLRAHDPTPTPTPTPEPSGSSLCTGRTVVLSVIGILSGFCIWVLCWKHQRQNH